MLALERLRSQRTGRPFALLMVGTDRSAQKGAGLGLWPSILEALTVTTRDSDMTGWIERNASIGVLLTEVSGDGALDSLRSRIIAVLKEKLTAEELRHIRFDTPAPAETLRPQNSRTATPASHPSLVTADSRA